MKQIFFLLLLTGLSLHLAGCFTAVFTMPEGGTKIDPDDLVADVRGNYYHDLSGCSAVEYEGFTITRAGLEPLRAYLRLNTQHYADWRVDPLVWEGAVLNAMVSSTIIPPEIFPAERDQNVLQGYCRGKYRHTEGVETFSANPVDLKGIPAVEYRLTGRSPKREEWMVHGYMLFLPSSPGRLMDMNYYLLRSGTQMDRLNGMGELFLDSVSFAD